jgi:hypothetical protein
MKWVNVCKTNLIEEKVQNKNDRTNKIELQWNSMQHKTTCKTWLNKNEILSYLILRVLLFYTDSLLLLMYLSFLSLKKLIFTEVFFCTFFLRNFKILRSNCQTILFRIQVEYNSLKTDRNKNRNRKKGYTKEIFSDIIEQTNKQI